MTDLIREISQTVGRNKLRMALTGFAVAWGVFMLIVLLGIAQGVVNEFEDKMLGRDNYLLTIWGGQTEKVWKGLKEGRTITLEEKDLGDIGRNGSVPARAVSASIGNDTVVFSANNMTLTGGYYGASPESMYYDDINMSAGRFINNRDMQQRRRAIVIESDDARRIFGSDSAAVGKIMTGMGLAWTVTGVYAHRWRSTVYVPYSTAAALAANADEVESIDVELGGVSTKVEGREAEQAVRETLAQNHSFDPEDKNAIWVWNRFLNNLEAVEVLNILVMTMWIIGILTLLTGIVGVSNIMFVSVRERKHEIGIRRAIGARPRSILTQVVWESVAITILFGYIGIVAGTIVNGIISTMTKGMDIMRDPGVTLSTALQVTVVLVAAGAIAGLFPAIKATKVRPVEALRDE